MVKVVISRYYLDMKFRKSDVEIIKLTAREILLTMFDISTPFYEASSIYRKSIRKYLENRSVERSNFLRRIRYLKNQGYIETFVENKEKYAELTPKGRKQLQNLLLENITIVKTSKWDGKWRVVIFDIPEDLHSNRDRLRSQLKRLNFIQVQQSVYIFPFDCTLPVAALSEMYNVDKYVLIMISEVIQGEKKIIEQFIEAEVLNKSDIRT